MIVMKIKLDKKAKLLMPAQQWKNIGCIGECF